VVQAKGQEEGDLLVLPIQRRLLADRSVARLFKHALDEHADGLVVALGLPREWLDFLC